MSRGAGDGEEEEEDNVENNKKSSALLIEDENLGRSSYLDFHN